MVRSNIYERLRKVRAALNGEETIYLYKIILKYKIINIVEKLRVTSEVNFYFIAVIERSQESKCYVTIVSVFIV